MARLNVQVGRPTVFSRIIYCLLGAGCLFAGSVALWGIGHMVYDGASTYFWQETPCVIESATVDREGGVNGDALFLVQYRWTWEGREHTGDRLFPHYQESSLTGANSLLVAYPPGRRTTCYVDPEDPSQATLQRPAAWRGLILLVPFPFLGIGVLLLWWVISGSRRFFARQAVAGHTSDPVDSRKWAWFGIAFCSLFFFAGIGIAIPYLVMPALEWWDAQDWPEVPATVVSSRVQTHSGDDSSDTYSVDVLFRYRAGGQVFHSDRYELATGSSSGYESKAEIVERYPPGARVTAYVDPDNPGAAVLYRGLSGQWLVGLLPLLFVGAGGFGMGMLWRSFLRTPKLDGSGGDRYAPTRVREERSADGGAMELETAATPLGKLFGTIFFAVVWNGITGVFIWAWWEEYQGGGPDGCLTLFLIPFVLVGLLLLISVPYQFLATFNPRPVLRVDRRLEPGTEAALSWHFKGPAKRVRKLTVTLSGEERATYRRGTDTHTASETFHRQVLVDTDTEVARGTATLTIPEGTMHTFQSSNNQVVWHLVLHGTIRYWPDVQDRFPLVVHPREVER